MASSTPTRCPRRGGPASFHADDGVTYCESTKPCGMVVEDPKYKPPSYRGGSKADGGTDHG